MKSRAANIIALLALAIWLGSGVYTIKPNEQGVLLLMGKVRNSSVKPGLHWRLPEPIARVIKVKSLETRRVGVGALLIEAATATAGETGRNEFVTGDKNLVNLELVVQYQIKDPEAYLFQAGDVDGIIAALAESGATRAAGNMTVNEVFYQDKARLQQRVRAALLDEIEVFNLGVSITSVTLQKVRPAPEVTKEFNDVITAKADALRVINEAESYSSDLLPRARGEAAATVEGARGAAFEIVKIASGKADRFSRVFEEYRHAPALTRFRLYTQTLESILQVASKVIVDPSGGGSVVQFLSVGGGQR